MLKKAMDFGLDPNDPADAKVRAALATALLGAAARAPPQTSPLPPPPPLPHPRDYSYLYQ